MVNSRRIRKWLTAGLALLVVAGNVLPAAHTAEAAPDNSKVVISQVYGGGGNSGAEYKNDFIELYNPTETDVNLTGWKVRYASASASIDETKDITSLNGTIPAKGYYLIQQAAGTGGTKDLPAPDSIGTLAMSGSNGKVDLLNVSNQRMDIVGYGPTANESETVPTAVLSSTTSAIRKAAAGASADSRGQDTDNNSVDFVTGSPSPRNSSYGQTPTTASPVVAAPAPNAWPTGTAISLSTPTVGASVYAAVYGSGGTEQYKLYTNGIELSGQTEIKAYASAPNLADSPVSTFKYTILNKTDIATARSAAKSQNISTQGIVTHIDGPEMYIQDGSAAIVLYGFPAFANVGDLVEVSGAMEIFNSLQEIKQQAGLNHKVITANAGVPAPKLLTAADLSTANGENHEAELVTMENVTIVSKSGSTVKASQGGQEFTIYSSLSKLDPGQGGKTFERITGVIKQFNAVYQFIPLNENALVENVLSVMASPGAGRIIIGSQVALSSPASGAAIYYTVDGSNPTTASTPYSTPITVNQNVTIKAIAVAAGQASKVYTFSYVASEAPRIHDIQGESHTSEFAGQSVTDIEGIVTQYGYTFTTGGYKGFFMQDPHPDNNLNTSEGIFVFSTNEALKPKIGDLVSVTGTVSEHNEGSSSNLTSTQITLNSRTILSSGAALPDPVVLGAGGRVIPSSIIDNDDMKAFQPAEDAIDFYESLEGMIVKLPAPTILSPYWTSGNGSSLVYNIPTRVDNGTADVITPAGGLVLKEYKNYNPQRLLIAYGNPGQEVGTGDKFAGDVTGVIGYNNGNFKVIPEFGKLPAITTSSFKQETSTIEVNAEKLLIASYNIENYYPGVGAAKTQKLAESITANMKKPDIIGVVEMQDSNGETDNGTVEANATGLIQAIQAAGGPVYKYIDIAPEDKKDGGAPGGNIRVGFLYNPARVELADSVNGQKGTATQSVGYNAAADKLTYNPGRIDPANDNFTGSRKPLAAQFVFGGEKVIVIANHFNSKGGDNGPFGNIQPPVLSSESQRHKIAAIVNGFVKEVLTANPNANIVALGDLNDFQFTPTSTILKGNQLDNLIDKLPLNERYTYTFDGNSQVLDHILVSKNLTDAADVDVIHLNADFPASRGRVSDHDAVMAQIDLKTFPLRILHTNDTHANLDTKDNSPDNITRRITAIKQERSEVTNSLLVDAGDVFSGTLYFNKYEGLADLAFMNMAGYDAMTFGNHEFDKGPAALFNFVSQAKFPFVSANIDFSQETKLSGIFKRNEIGNPGNDATIYPSVIMDVYGEKVGIFGLTTEETTTLANPGPNIVFKDHIESAKATVKSLKEAGINKIIVLSHLGYTVDQALVDQVEGIDIVVGGHSHTKLDAPEVHTAHGYPQLIVQASEKSNYLGELDMLFDKKGELKSFDGHLIDINAKVNNKYVIPADPEALSLLNSTYKPGVEELSGGIVGKSSVLLDGKRDNVRSKETNLGNLVADSMLYKADADIAIQNGGGIRESIDLGDITQGEIISVLPFNNDLVTLKMTGQEIWDSLELGVSTVETKQGRFPHVAGMRFYYDSTKPANKRVVKAEIKKNGVYQNLNLEAMYTVATNAFIADGGDGYASMKKAKNDGRINLLYYPDFQVLTDYIKKHSPITIGIEGRITDLKGGVLPTPTPMPTTPPGESGTAPVPTASPKPSPTATPASSAAPHVTTITAADLTAQLAKLPAGSSELVIPVTASENGAQIVLPGSVIVKQAAAQPNTVLTFTAGGTSYSMPVSIVNGTALAAQLGTSDFTITVSIVHANSATLSSVNKAIAAQQGSITLAGPMIEFTVTAQAGNKSVPLNNFGSTYVKRTITVRGALNPQNATAVVFDLATGKFSFVPSVFTVKADGTTEVTIKRNSNSYYTVVQSAKSFGDVTGHWAKSSIELLASKQIVSGTSSAAFSPSQSVTRAEFAAMITRALGLATVSGGTTFSDVSPSKWYAGAIQTASAAGLISGYTDGSFHPDSPISRQEMAAVLAKAIKFTGATLNSDPAALAKFSDAAGIPAWSKAAVAEIASAGIIQGAPDGSFAPQKLATRAEAVTMLEKTLKSLKFID